jgi:hypothetical protein
MLDRRGKDRSGTTIRQREQGDERRLFGAVALASRLEALDEPSAAENYSGPYLLHDSPYGLQRASYEAAEDDRADVEEDLTLAVVEVAAEWREINVPHHADALVREAVEIINAQDRDFGFSETMQTLFATLEPPIVAISIPTGDGRTIWLPMLTLVSGMIDVVEYISVPIRRPATPQDPVLDEDAEGREGEP